MNPTFDLPLAYGQLKIADILKDVDSTHFKTDPDGLLYVAYDDELLSEDVRDLFELPDFTVNKSFVLPGMVIPPHNDDIRTDSIQSVMEFPLDPEKLDEIGLNGGKITYSVTLNPSTSNLNYEVFLVLNGFKSRTTNKTLNTVIKGNNEIDISDNSITLNDNKWDLKLVLVFKKSNTTTTIAPATSVNVRLQFENLGFEYLKGFFGDQTTSMDPSSTPISLFEDNVFTDAEISLAQPKVTFSVFNENGVPCTVDFKKLEVRKKGADPLNILLDPANPIVLASPAVMGETKVTTINVVNVKDLLNYAPSELFYQADVRINEGLTSGNNFMIDTSAMRVGLHIEVPLWGSATGIVLQDTLDIDLEDVETSQVEKASLKLDLINQFPLGGNVQFVLTDAKYKPLTTLLLPEQTNVLKASTVNAAGELQAPGIFDDLIELDKSKIENLFQAKHLILVANLETSRNPAGNATDVKFKADYGLSINTKVVATLKLTVE